jgi:hypothetical protein
LKSAELPNVAGVLRSLETPDRNLVPKANLKGGFHYNEVYVENYFGVYPL